MIKSSVASKTLGNSRSHVNEHTGEGLLPTIFKVEKYYGSKEGRTERQGKLRIEDKANEELLK